LFKGSSLNFHPLWNFSRCFAMEMFLECFVKFVEFSSIVELSWMPFEGSILLNSCSMKMCNFKKTIKMRFRLSNERLIHTPMYHISCYVKYCFPIITTFWLYWCQSRKLKKHFLLNTTGNMHMYFCIKDWIIYNLL